MNLNFSSGNIEGWYYNLSDKHLPHAFHLPILAVPPDYLFKDKIILIRSNRYQNAFIDYKKIEKYSKQLVFMGLQDEYEDFRNKYFDLEFYRLEDAYEAARLMTGSLGVIANQTGLFAIAEILKVKRCLETAEFIYTADKKITQGPVNVMPVGGWFECVSTNFKLTKTVEELLTKN